MKNFFAALFLIFVAMGCQKDSVTPSNLIHYIPKDASLIIKISNLSTLQRELKNNDFITEIATTSFYKDIVNHLKSVSQLKTKQEVLFCVYEIGKRNFEYTIISKYQKNLFPLDSVSEKSIEHIKYDGEEIKKIIINNEISFIAIINGVFINSSSQLLVENSIRQRNVNNSGGDDIFYKLYNISNSKNLATVFINTTKISAFSDIFFENHISKQIRGFADWAAIEVSISSARLTFSGIAMANPSSSKVINLFNKTIPQEHVTAKFTPINAEGFMSFTFNNYAEFKANLNRQEGVETIHSNENDSIFKWINEIGIVFEHNAKGIVMRSSDVENTKNLLVHNALPVSVFREIPVYQCHNPQLFAATFSNLISNAAIHFYAFLDDGVLFSNTIASLQNMITNYLNEATLAYDASYKNFISELNEESSILMVGLHPNFKTSMEEMISDAYKKDIASIHLNSYPYFAFQVIRDSDFAHIYAVLKKMPAKHNSATITQLFTVVLDADVSVSPQLVNNHSTKQKEIIVQDVENTIYLISNSGKVLWKKKLDSKIKGEFHQVDLYGNGKLQLAFTTEHRLYLIDRNGKEVAPFPLHFNDDITQPLAVFDYDTTKNYRFLVCQSNRVKLYDEKGKTVSGFSFAQTQSNVLTTPRHFKIGTNDYISILEENGILHLLDRAGKTRIAVKNTIKFSENALYLYNDTFMTTTKTGNLIQLDQKGNIITRNLNLQENHKINCVQNTLVILSDNILMIKDKKVTLDFGLYTTPQIFYVNNNIYVAITDMQTNKVYLYDGNAMLLPHFPVYGMSSMDLDDIDNDNKLEFTVKGDKNNVLVYKIN